MESGSASESSQEELFQKVDIERLISTFVCYQPQTDLSRNLLQGVLYKNGRLPKTIEPIQSETNTKTGRRIYVTSKYPRSSNTQISTSFFSQVAPKLYRCRLTKACTTMAGLNKDSWLVSKATEGYTWSSRVMIYLTASRT